MLTSFEIREKFLDYFKSKGHQIVPSAPIVIKNDPTLMFTNAGMNQFKDYFLGNKQPSHNRIADTQKCLRVSGKHNDLEEVGVDTYHHTMFEMLGNWSFGDYFKKDAIEWSWELLTAVYQIPKDRLYVTVFEGDEKDGLPKDEEAAREWEKWISPDRILLGNKKDNFWEMGDTGPCGPCTEIHVDTRTDEERQKIDGKSLVNADHPQVIEIWNNVFIQFNRQKNGSLESLPAKHVDTGMGFERLVRVLQAKQSNYDTDVFSGTIEKIKSIVNLSYEGGDNKKDIAFRVISDHIRAISFTIADGQLPSNTGAGYVIRRILRRAVRYYYSYLDYKTPLLYQLLPVIANQFELVFPELNEQQSFVAKVIKEEEESFLRTLEKGLKRINDLIDKPGKLISGKDSFELYDTYGFPIDLTRLIAAEKGYEVDEEGFEKEMSEQKNRSRAATVIDAGDWIILNEGSSTEFVGYEILETESTILKYRKVNTKNKQGWQLVLNRTPFYAESGGQVGDKGVLIFNKNGTNSILNIIDTKKENNLIIHITEELPNELDSNVIAKVDHIHRQKTALNHSATHLMHAALRNVLGTHVIQKGSLVNADYLRFDFAHYNKLSSKEIQQVESLVNQKIRDNIAVVIKYMNKDEAVATGAMALFGEKYGDIVRVVIIDPDYSIELCGGTHVGSTGELGLFKIVSETAIASGVRRIEAICGEAALNYLDSKIIELDEVKELLKNPKDLNKAIMHLIEENNSLKKVSEKYELDSLKGKADQLKTEVKQVKGFSFLGQIVDVSNAEALKKLGALLKSFSKDNFIVLGAAIDGKAHVLIQIDEKVVIENQLDASKIIKQQVAPLIKGGGGGQKTLATAGGQDITALHQVIETVEQLIKSI